jgi:hypothetical protein
MLVPNERAALTFLSGCVPKMPFVNDHVQATLNECISPMRSSNTEPIALAGSLAARTSDSVLKTGPRGDCDLGYAPPKQAMEST